MPVRFSSRHAGAIGLSLSLLVFSHPAFAGFQWVAPAPPVEPPALQAAPVVSGGVAPATLPTSFVARPSSVEPSSSVALSPSALSGVNAGTITVMGAPDVVSPVVITGAASSAPMPITLSGGSAGGGEAAVYTGPTAGLLSERPSSLSAMPQESSPPLPVAAESSTGLTMLTGMAAPLPGAAPGAPTKAEDIVRGFANKVPLAVALRQILPAGFAFSVDQGVDVGTLVSFQGGRPWRETLREALMPAGLMAREQGQMVSIGYGAAPVSDHALRLPSSPSAARSPGMSVALAAPSSIPASARADSGAVPMAQTMPVVVNPPAAAVPTATVEEWNAERGDSLRKILEGWSRRARVEFNWLAEYDYPMQASAAFNGTFEDAVRNLLTGFEDARPQPVAELHANPQLGQMVLVVQTRGNTGQD